MTLLAIESRNERSEDSFADLFSAARACLEATDPDAKTKLSANAARAWRERRLPLGPRDEVLGDVTPGRPPELRLVGPLRVPKRKLRTPHGHAAFVHAIAHIEFNAVNLAWDCVARFRDFPREYYDDWVAVAAEEAVHFTMLSNRLRDLNCRYGAFEAHDGLWEMAEKTAHDALSRMAMVPRYLEARGLDVAPAMIERLEKAGDAKTAAIVRVILRDEVAHVAAGTKWFRHLCEARGEDPDVRFSELLDRYLSGTLKGPLNLSDRRLAGFSEAELAGLHARTAAGNR